MSSKELIQPHQIPFSVLSSLIYKIGRIQPRKVGEKRKHQEGHYPAYEIFEQWVKDLRRHYSPLPAGTTSIIFRVLFPQEDARRKFDIKEKKMTRLLANCLSVKEESFLVWDSEEGLGCLGLELKELMDKSYSGTSDSLSLAEVDALLDELSCLSSFTDPALREAIRKTRPKRSRAEIIRSLFRRLSPEDACVVTQVILKDLRPLLYPYSASDYTSALTKYNSASVKILSKEHAMNIWDGSGLMLKFHRLRSCIDSAAAFADNADKSLHDIKPQIGQALAIPKSEKGISVEKVIEQFATRKAGIVWAETKYDGERAQIHVEIRNNNPHITIYSKSKRNSTLDRHGIHHIIRQALGFDRQESPVTVGTRAVKRNIVLDAEMVACNGEKIDEFWRIRQLIDETARGPRAGRRRTKAPDADCPESMRSDLNDDFSLGLVFFDIMVLDDVPLLWKPYYERRRILESFIRVEKGKSMLAERHRIDMQHPFRTTRLKEIFQQHIDDHQEGLVLKSEDSYYNDWKNPWVKLKKDYIPGHGDTLSMVVLGASWNKDRARELKVSPTTFTTFYIGVLTNTQDVKLDQKARPRFDLYFAVEYGLTRVELEAFNTMIKACDTVPVSEKRSLKYDVTILDEIKPCPPSILLEDPVVVELYGAGFTKAPHSKHYELRFPRIQKFFRRKDRNWAEAADWEEVRNAAQESVGHAQEETPSQWAQRIWTGAKLNTLPPLESVKIKEDPDLDVVAEELPAKKRRHIGAPTPPPSSPIKQQILSPPFTQRTNTVHSQHELVPYSPPAVSHLSSSSRLLTVFSPMCATDSPEFTVGASQVPIGNSQFNVRQALVWFARPSQEKGCPAWSKHQERVPWDRRTRSLNTLLDRCGWRDEPASRRIQYGLIIVDQCHETKGDVLMRKTFRLITDAAEESKNPACLPIYIVGCREDADDMICDVE